MSILAQGESEESYFVVEMRAKVLAKPGPWLWKQPEGRLQSVDTE